MRKGGKPLTEQAIEAIWMYYDYVLDIFGDDSDDGRAEINRDENERRAIETSFL